MLACTPSSEPAPDVSGETDPERSAESTPATREDGIDPAEPAEAEPTPTQPDKPNASPMPEGTEVRAFKVLKHEDWLGQEIVVDIYEPIRNARHSSAAPSDGFDVEVSDGKTDILNLVPDGQTLRDLPADLVPPFRVRATLRRNALRESSSHRKWRTLEVHEIWPLSFPEPTPVRSAKAVLANPRKWHGRYAELQGVWKVGFEISRIGDIWIDAYPSVERICAPAPAPDDAETLRGFRTQEVRLVGYVYTKARQYGMGGKASLVATKITFLDTPGCTPE